MVPKKILIIEDDEQLVRSYMQAFKVSGFEIEAATNGKDGLEKIYTFSPDLILLDVMMPELNGIEVLTQIRQNLAHKLIPVVMLTNLSEKQYIDQIRELGVTDYIIKSNFKPREIVEKVKVMLDIN